MNPPHPLHRELDNALFQSHLTALACWFMFVSFILCLCSYFFVFLCLEIQLLPVIRRSSSLWNWKYFLQSFLNFCQEATVHFGRHGWAKRQKRDRRNLPQSRIYSTGEGFLWFFWSVSLDQSDKTKCVFICQFFNIFYNNGHLHGQISSLLHSVKILADLPSKVESLQLRLMILQGVCKSSTALGGWINWDSPVSVPKRNTSCSQPELLVGWKSFFSVLNMERATKITLYICICILSNHNNASKPKKSQHQENLHLVETISDCLACCSLLVLQLENLQDLTWWNVLWQ